MPKRRWHVVINVSLANQVVAKQILHERLKDANPRVTPYGGSRRRVILEVGADTYNEAGDLAIRRLEQAFVEWDRQQGAHANLDDAWVMHVSTEPPAPSEWDNLA